MTETDTYKKSKWIFFLSTLVFIFSVLYLGWKTIHSKTGENDSELRVVIWGLERQIEFVNDQIESFRTEHPELNAKVYHAGYVNHFSYVNAMTLAGHPPDLFYMQPSYLNRLRQRGLVAPIDDYFYGSDLEFQESFLPHTLTAYKQVDAATGEFRLWGLCKDWSPDFLIFYNKDRFDAANIPYPDGSWTLDEFVEVCQKLTQQDPSGRTSVFGVTDNAHIGQWIAQFGAHLFNDDKTKVNLTSPEFIEAIQFRCDLINTHKVAPGLETLSHHSPEQLFLSRRTAMFFNGLWFSPKLQDIDFNWGVTTPPIAKRKIFKAHGFTGYALSSKSRNPEAAWKLMKFLVGETGQKMGASLAWNIPSNRSVAQSDIFLENPNLPDSVISTFLEASHKTEYIEISPWLGEFTFNTMWEPTWQSLLNNAPLKPTLRKLEAKMNKLMEENQNTRE